MPIGTIISFMGTIPPENYLVCDGTVLNIEDYPYLADFFEVQFGTKNNFGGDGTTTFALPDLRGEFLRGTGINSHENQGSGANVGVHQDATQHLNIGASLSGTFWGFANTQNTEKVNPDSTLGVSSEICYGVQHYAHSSDNTHYTSRPTNTSVLYCIKAN